MLNIKTCTLASFVALGLISLAPGRASAAAIDITSPTTGSDVVNKSTITVNGTIMGTAPAKLRVYIIRIDPTTKAEIGNAVDTKNVSGPGGTWTVTLDGPDQASGTSYTYKIKAVGENSNGTPTGDSGSIEVNCTVSGGP